MPEHGLRRQADPPEPPPPAAARGLGQASGRGAQYRSIILTPTPEQQAEAEASRDHYQKQVSARGLGEITTSILLLNDYYYAESYHQQYLVKNPGGYCPLPATGIRYDD